MQCLKGIAEYIMQIGVQLAYPVKKPALLSSIFMLPKYK